MTSGGRTHSPSNLALFREKVAAARRQTGHLQKELADVLGIDAQVLSRKLHGAKQAFPTHAEVKQIIKTLAAWDAIITQSEAIDLLSSMGLRAESFSPEEWATAPLNRLEAAPPSRPSIVVSPSTFPSHPIPPLPMPSASLLGREHHIQLLMDRLRQPSVRLLTLLGTGGVGKTCLALALAREARRTFADGVFFVSLATLRDASFVPSTIVQALHLSEPVPDSDPGRQGVQSHEDVLKDFLHSKEFLLVLDNLEQIPEIVPFLNNLLRATVSLKLLVTSRSVLHLDGEHEFVVPPLAVCAPDQVSNPGYISQFPAICLFIERAQAINPTFQLTEYNAATIAHICARLDGLPLAIELAAVRTKVLPLPLILKRLVDGNGQRLTFLRSTASNIPQRHQTLQETLDWSYQLLDPQQQCLFRRLGVFLGGWTLPSALAICFPQDPPITPDDLFEQLLALINHSLVKQASQGGTSREPQVELRYHFLETIYEYAWTQLEASGERNDLQRRHATYYLELVESLESALSGPEHTAAVSILSQEQDNLRAALMWAVENHEHVIAVRLCGGLGRYWEARTQFQEAHRWLDMALMSAQYTSSTAHAKLLMAASRIALWETDCERARVLAQQALDLYKVSEDSAGKALALFQLGDTWHMQGEYALATQYFVESLPFLSAQENWRMYAFTLSRLGAVATLQSNFAQAQAWLDEALTLLRQYSEPVLLNVTLVYQGTLALVQGDLHQSIAYLREGFLLAQQTGNHYMLATALISLGCLLGIVREPSYAARLCSAAEAFFASLNTALPIAYRPLYETFLGSIKSQVDPTIWSVWWVEGKTLTLEEISALVSLP